MSDNKNNIEHQDNSVSDNDQPSSLLSEAEIAYLNEIWKPVNTSTTPSMLSRNTSKSRDFDRFMKNIKLEGI